MKKFLHWWLTIAAFMALQLVIAGVVILAQPLWFATAIAGSL